MVPYAFLYSFVLSAVVATQALPCQRLWNVPKAHSSVVYDEQEGNLVLSDRSFRTYILPDLTGPPKEPKGILDRLALSPRQKTLAPPRARAKETQTSIVVGMAVPTPNETIKAVKGGSGEERYKKQLFGTYAPNQRREETILELQPREAKGFAAVGSQKIQKHIHTLDTRSWIAGRPVNGDDFIRTFYRNFCNYTKISVLKSCHTYTLEKRRSHRTLPSPIYSTSGAPDIPKDKILAALAGKSPEIHSTSFQGFVFLVETSAASSTSKVINFNNNTVIWTDKVIQRSFEKIFVVFCIGIGIAMVLFLFISFLRKNLVFKNLQEKRLTRNPRSLRKTVEKPVSAPPGFSDQSNPEVLDHNTLLQQNPDDLDRAQTDPKASRENWCSRIFRQKKPREKDRTHPTSEVNIYRHLASFLRRPDVIGTPTNKNLDTPIETGLPLNIVNKRLHEVFQNIPTNDNEESWASGLQNVEGRETLRDRRTGLRNSWLSSLFVNKVPGTENLIIIDDGQGVLHGTTGRQPEILEESSGVISAETEEASTQIERNMSLRVVETNLLGRLRSQSHSPQLGKISPGDRHAKEQFGDPPENGDLGQGSRVPFTSSHSLKSPIRIKSAGGHLNVAQWNLEMSELKSNYQHSKVSPYHLADSIKGTGTATELNAQVATDGAEHRSSISAANIMANTLLESDLKEIKPAVLTLKTRGLPILNSEEYFPTSIRSERIDDVFSHHVLPSLYSVCSDSTITSEPETLNGTALFEREGIDKPAIFHTSTPHPDNGENSICNPYPYDLGRSSIE